MYYTIPFNDTQEQKKRRKKQHIEVAAHIAERKGREREREINAVCIHT